MHRLLVLIGLLAVLQAMMSPAAQAMLVFEERRIEVDAPIGAETVDVAFAFTHAGDSPITITDLDSSCGCTIPSLSDSTIQPGEEGAVTVQFTIGDRVGEQVKRIVLSTDAPTQPRITLTLVVRIPEVIDFEPGLVIWPNGQARMPRRVALTLVEHEAVSLLGLGAIPEGLSVELIESGGQAHVLIDPADDLEDGAYLVPVRVQIMDEERIFSLPLRVLGQGPDAG